MRLARKARSLGRTLRSERGDIAGDTLMFPILILILFVCVNFALVYRGKQVVSAAAQDGARVGAAEWGDEAIARRTANETLSFSSIVSAGDVDVSHGSKNVTVEVEGIVTLPFLGWTVTVESRADSPRERVLESTNREGG